MNQKSYAENYIPLADCAFRYIYKVVSRNLTFTVYNGNGGFIGIREKWGTRYLFTEYHWDNGPPFGTVCPIEKMDVLPEEILLREYEPTTDASSKRTVAFDAPKEDGGVGWYYIDTGEADPNIIPVSGTYKPLLDYLEQFALLHKEEDINDECH
jgi:hypothetical protein